MNACTTLVDSPLKAAKERLRISDLWVMLDLPGRPAKSCRSPFREDRNASFSVYHEGRRWKDHATGEGGDEVDFVASACDLSTQDACRKLIDLAGTRKEKGVSPPASRKVEPCDPLKDEEKARRREGWPPFEPPTRAEIGKIAMLRSLSPEGVALAHERGLLFCADTIEGRAWIVTDSRRNNAQARRMDGEKWERIDAKAWTLPGSVGALPIGLHEALDFPNIALVEGGPDLLAAFHLAYCATPTPETLARGKGVDVLGKLGVVAMLGRHPIPKGELRHFKDRCVRIFAHADKPGLQAEGRWWHQLEEAGATVDGYSLAGFIRSDGKPVGDLNDFTLIGPDQWEEQRDALEEAFHFKERKANEPRIAHQNQARHPIYRKCTWSGGQ
jgi:hypothetical protein